ncbi:MAG TPA: VCBS repeat-containing protein [Pyrinomonadaceae bacterium]|jgi:hypothetical protein|nr:VCBS repeat-containing protein [Pyrinomonadaceae bacterium]
MKRYLFPKIMVILLLAPMTSSGGWASRVAQRSQSTRTVTLVCVVSRPDTEDPQGNMDAVVLVENGKLKQPYPEYNEAAQKKFAGEYFRVGTKYRVTFGGGEVGSATVKGYDMGCNNIHATATVEDNGKIPPHLSALATNSELLGKMPSARRAPTDAERQAAMKLVNQIYRSRGTTPGLLRTLKTTNLTATDLDGDGKFELIGSFVIETQTKARRDLLLIAEPVGAAFKGALVNFQSYKLPSEGFDSAVDFVDQLDLDGDGVAEVFVQQHGFDAYGYSIYKKSHGRWRQVYTTTGDAC